MSKKKVVTNEQARLKILATIALVEAEDSRCGPSGVGQFAKEISTDDLQSIFAITSIYAIRLTIANVLTTRDDITAHKLFAMASEAHPHIKKILIESATARMPEGAIHEHVELLYEFASIGTAIETSIRSSLERMPKGTLYTLLENNSLNKERLVIAELKRRNDPVKENALRILTKHISENAQRDIIHLFTDDSRITARHIIEMGEELPEHRMVTTLLHVKIAGTPMASRLGWYAQSRRESFRMTIIGGLGDVVEDATEHIDYLIEHAETDAVHAAVIRTLGPHLPLERLLALRGATKSKEVVEVFEELFGEHDRYLELQRFLAL